jgi:hypothetical protein
VLKNVSTVLDTRVIISLYFTSMFLMGYHSEVNVTLNTRNNKNDFGSIAKLLQAMRYDPVINKKVVSILKMESYPRHIVLSNWLEQLRRSNAPQKLLRSLACLFDDGIAEKVRVFMRDHNIKNNENS